jgi:hypothetical protein
VVVTNLQAAMPGAKVSTRPATITALAATGATGVTAPAAAQATLAR